MYKLEYPFYKINYRQNYKFKSASSTNYEDAINFITDVIEGDPHTTLREFFKIDIDFDNSKEELTYITMEEVWKAKCESLTKNKQNQTTISLQK